MKSRAGEIRVDCVVDEKIKELLLSHVTNSEIEEQINKMGVKTRDENGNVRSLDSIIGDVSRELSSSIKHML